MIDICVIGAGSAGLCAAKYISASYNYRCIVFEQTGAIGGTWVYTEDTCMDKFGNPIHSSMYDCLKTTLPKEVMQFKGFPFPPGKDSFVDHRTVLQYLKDYAKHYDLYKHIQFYKKVVSVNPMNEIGKKRWLVKVEDLETKTIQEYFFDAVMVCNGHYSDPNIPHIPGIKNFKGMVIHSHEFRRKEPFAGKNVVIWGASSSGLDIALEIRRVAKSVAISHRPTPKIHSELPKNVRDVANVVSAFETGFKFDDGTTCEADAFIYCTGYLYTFPFLSKECKIKVNDNRVTPLYKHLINIEHPTMCFPGIPLLMLPFVMFDYQIQFFLKTLEGSLVLPSKEEMLLSSEKELQRRLSLNMPKRYAHMMDFLQWEYYDDLASSAKLQRLDPVVRKLYENLRIARRDQVMHYKAYHYEIIDSNNFNVTENRRWD